MTEEMKVCQCGSMKIPGLYPDHRFSDPDKQGEIFVTGVIPAWICPNCGDHNLVKKEEMSDWLFSGIRFKRANVRAINLLEKLIDMCPKFKAMFDEPCDCGFDETPHKGRIH